MRRPFSTISRFGLVSGLALGFVLSAGPLTIAAAQQPALEGLSATARANRRDAAAQGNYGLALLRAGKLREAQRALQAAARLDRESPARAFDVARVAFARGEYRPARAACRPLERFEDSALSHVCQARAFLVWNRSARAFEELETAAAEHPEEFEAQLALGDAHRLRGAVAESEAAYQRAARLRSNSALPYLGLGRLYTAARRRDDAIRALRTADGKSELEGGSARPDAGHPAIAYELGRALGNADGVPFLRRASAGRPGWLEAQVALGDALLAGGDAAGAKVAYEGAVAVSRRSADAHVGLGRAMTALGEHEAAMAEFDRAIALVENHPGAVLAKAKLFEASGANEDAFREYRRAADLMARNPEPLVSAASLALRLNRDVLAVGFLDRVLTQHPRFSRALELYGDAMVARRDRTRARQYYERALEGTGPVDRSALQRKLRSVR